MHLYLDVFYLGMADQAKKRTSTVHNMAFNWPLVALPGPEQNRDDDDDDHPRPNPIWLLHEITDSLNH